MTGIALLADPSRTRQSNLRFGAGIAMLAAGGGALATGLQSRKPGGGVGVHARLAALIESSADAIISDDLSGIVTSWNPAAERLYGYPATEAIGRPVSFIGPSDRPDELGKLRAHILAGQRIENFETIHTRQGGDPIDVWITMAPIRGADGEIIGTSIIGRDVGERKRTLSSLAHLAQELSRSNAELEQFAYIASHDLQEPLRMVASYTQLLARRYRGRLDQDADDFINFAVDGATRMQSLINGLLAYSRVGTRGAAMASVDMNEALAIALKDLRHALEDAGAVVTHDPLPTVHYDATQLTELLQNLIANAVKFRRDDAPLIHIGAQADDRIWTISVTDNGIGIPPEYLDRVFDIFQWMHEREDFPGTGIGLAVCKRIVERHGGRIWAESVPGEGATFSFTVPPREGGSP